MQLQIVMVSWCSLSVVLQVSNGRMLSVFHPLRRTAWSCDFAHFLDGLGEMLYMLYGLHVIVVLFARVARDSIVLRPNPLVVRDYFDQKVVVGLFRCRYRRSVVLVAVHYSWSCSCSTPRRVGVSFVP